MLQHIEIDLQYIKEVFDSIKSHLKKGQNIILRSTIAPGTMEYLKKKLEQDMGWKVGKDIYMSFCPERLAEGKALEELKTLPQIIGADDITSSNKAIDLFSKINSNQGSMIPVSIKEAELIKLFCNIARYMQFSTVNYLAIIAETYKCDIHKLLNIINKDYPRPIYGKVGLTAGTCLRKDWGMINESIPYADMLVSAYKVNEYMPKFLVETAKQFIGTYDNKIVGILGYAFKKDTDDMRDSLTPKLIRYVEREVPKEIYVNDPLVLNDIGYTNHGLNKFGSKTDIIFLLTNHEIYEKYFDKIYSMAKIGCLFVDIWNIGKKGKMFYFKEE